MLLFIRRTAAIAQKDLQAFLGSPLAYVIMVTFLLLTGLSMWVFPDTNLLDSGYATLQPFFCFVPYLLMLFVPAITMSSLAEEKSKGTLEVLLTTPLSATQLVVGKFIAHTVMVLCMLLPTAMYPWTMYALSNGRIDIAATVGSYLGLIALVKQFVAIGIFTSALTRHQLVAFLLGVLLCFLLYQGLDTWAELQHWKYYALSLKKLGIHYHYHTFSKGIIAIQAIV